MPSKHKKKHNKSSNPHAQAGAPKPTSSSVTPDVHLTTEQSVPSPPRPPDVTAPKLIVESQPREMSPSNTNVTGNVVAGESPVITAVRALLNVIEKYIVCRINCEWLNIGTKVNKRAVFREIWIKNPEKMQACRVICMCAVHQVRHFDALLN